MVELGKESEYSLGKTLRIGNRDYSDLDELIVAHIKQMAVKVTEMVNHDKWRGTKEQLSECWSRPGDLIVVLTGPALESHLPVELCSGRSSSRFLRFLFRP